MSAYSVLSRPHKRSCSSPVTILSDIATAIRHRRDNVNVTADTRNGAGGCLTATYYAGYALSVTVSGISCDPNAVDRRWQIVTVVVIVVVLVAAAASCVADGDLLADTSSLCP